MEQVTIRSSTIFVAEGERTSVYRSLDEVPPELRRRIAETTAGQNSATILIADRRGRRELERAMNGLAPGIGLPGRQGPALWARDLIRRMSATRSIIRPASPEHAPAALPVSRRPGGWLRNRLRGPLTGRLLLEVLVPGLACVALWLLLTAR